jgi:DMSO/TMAO reductase YedYZ molybdopterin-dependent catalytic subunit
VAAISEQEYFEERGQGLSRRQLMALGAAGLGALAFPGTAKAAPIVKPLPSDWFIPLGTNAEMRSDAAAPLGYTIPAGRFFVRNHTSTPLIDPLTWRLTVSGSGLRDPGGHVFSLRTLRRLPAKTLTAFIECAGNGRSFFAAQQGSPAAGTQWGLGAAGSRAGAACRCARCSSGPASPGARWTSSPKGSTPRSRARAMCAGRCRWRRRSTTCCWPTR